MQSQHFSPSILKCIEFYIHLNVRLLGHCMADHDLQKIQVTKLDAVRRQLETAIILWFHDGDPVSIHTLAAAAYQIIYDINAHRGGAPMMRDSEKIRPEGLSEWRRIMAQ